MLRIKMIEILRYLKWYFIYPNFRYLFRNNRLNKFLRSKYRISNISVSKLYEYKSSDTLFILAAGQSINNLTNECFDEISNSDSIGINGFAYHTFVPRYFSFELENQQNPDTLKMFLDTSNNIIKLKDKYKKTAIIFRQNTFSDTSLEKNFKEIISWGNSFWNVFDAIPGNNLLEYKKYLNHYFELGLLDKDDFFPNKSSSLSWVISFAYQLKYKNIVFCGVDLFGDYFYLNEKPLSPEEFLIQKDKIHLTGDSNINGKVTIQDIVTVWNNDYFHKYGAQMFVSSEFSMLSNQLPVYKFNRK